MRRFVTMFVFAVVAMLALSACNSTGFGTPDDPLASEQYAIDQHGMISAWENSVGDGVVIAIVDTGIDVDHPEFAGKLVDGYDFVNDDEIPDDENGHGTHVAGSAAALGNNSIGVVGMAPNAKIMALKVLDGDGAGSTEDVAAAIVWAADHGADVINLSLGGSSDLLGRIYNKVDATNEAIAEAERKGVVVIAAAGNDDTFLTAYNSETPVLVVNATNEFGETARFSNFGDPRAVSAAGARIMSTAPTYPTAIWPDGTEGYAELDGTSMASPHVAGIAALLVGFADTPDDIREIIVDTASNPTEDPLLGAGIVKADLATDRQQSKSRLLILLLVGAGIATALVVYERKKRA